MSAEKQIEPESTAVFSNVEDWLEHLEKDGEVYKSERNMSTESPISLADLRGDCRESK